MTQAPQLTQTGYDEIIAELKDLEEVKRPAVIKRVELARSNGDLSENAEYHDAKSDQELIETRIAELRTVLETATIVKQTHSQTVVGIGSHVTVTVKSKRSEKKIVLQIVGEFEADPKAGKISSVSPLGSALMKQKRGALVEVAAPVGNVTYEVIDIK